MLTVTAKAKEKLLEALQRQTTDPGVALRIVPSASVPNRLDLVLDKEREGDEVTEGEDGVKLLLLGPELAPVLDGLIIDYQETPEGEGFTISKPSVSTS